MTRNTMSRHSEKIENKFEILSHAENHLLTENNSPFFSTFNIEPNYFVDPQ